MYFPTDRADWADKMRIICANPPYPPDPQGNSSCVACLMIFCGHLLHIFATGGYAFAKMLFLQHNLSVPRNTKHKSSSNHQSQIIWERSIMKNSSSNQKAHRLSSNKTPGMTRRQFAQLLGVAGTLGLVETPMLAKIFADSKKRLSWLAFRTPTAEGAWALTKVEGRVPKELNGTLYRVAPGQKDNHGILLKHLFDGDAFVSAYTFRDGKVSLKARFVDLPERTEELKAGKMLYSEFGTMAPSNVTAAPRRTGKNQPNVNIIYWDGRLLGLSEGGHPTAIDPQTLQYQNRWNYYGTLPASVPHTAHPKFDPTTGVGYCFGVEQGASFALTVFRMEKDGKLAKLYSVPLGGYHMVHDMLMSKEHLIFVVPPVKYNLGQLFSGKVSVADAVQYFEKEPTRYIILKKDGTGKPVVITQPSSMVFHHGNAYEENGKIVIDSCLSSDGTILNALYSWDKDALPKFAEPNLTRLTLDPVKGVVESRTELEESQEFPRFDSRQGGASARYLYTLESKEKEDFFVLPTLVRHDLQKGVCKRIDAGKGRTFGEPVFVSHLTKAGEERGWILMQGYDGTRDENFLDIRDAETLGLEARVWTGNHFPLGFHGNFYPNVFVNA
jgi:all-trans-8'-apo-beta-carotenal 15,15'-oxygenase